MDLEIYPYKIEIDANRADEGEHWRIYRINRIVGYAQALADHDNNENFLEKLKSIYDYKGKLTVSWQLEPSDKEKDYFQKAWASDVADCEGNLVEHEF